MNSNARKPRDRSIIHQLLWCNLYASSEVDNEAEYLRVAHLMDENRGKNLYMVAHRMVFGFNQHKNTSLSSVYEQLCHFSWRALARWSAIARTSGKRLG